MITLAHVCTFIVVGLILNGLSVFAQSAFFPKFIDNNLIVLLVALLAINTTTVSVILTKMREISDRHPSADFHNTRQAMKKATVEQVVLIIVSILFEILKGSPLAIKNITHAEFILDSLLIGVFAYSIQIVYDTAKGVYVILDHGH